jgi:hypothetical protein
MNSIKTKQLSLVGLVVLLGGCEDSVRPTPEDEVRPTPVVTAITLSPATAVLKAGETQLFAATAELSDGTTAAANVTYHTTSGTVSTAGLYTAGQTGGTFEVIATHSGGALADTAIVTVTPPITYFLATAETAGSIKPWQYTANDVRNPLPLSSADQARNGARAWKFEATNLCCFDDGFGGHATSVRLLSTFPEQSMGCPGDGYCGSLWYSFYAYVDAGYTEPEETGNWNLLLGWMTAPGSAGGVQPIANIGLVNRSGVLQLHAQQKGCSVGAVNCPDIPGYARYTGFYWFTGSSPAGIKPFPRGQWVHVSVYYKMAKTDGQITVWQDGEKIMDLTAPSFNTFDGTLGTNTSGSMLLQFGIYENQRPAIQRLYVDDFRVSDYRPVP